MSVIYKISCKDLNIKECYFGSTKNFIKRKCNHKYDCINKNSKQYNYLLYKIIRNNGGWQNWTIKVIEKIDSINKEIIRKCERKYIEENRDIAINKEIPGRTIIEWYQDNKEKKIKKSKLYYQDNKQKVPCDICNKIVTKNYLTKHQNGMKCFKLI